MVYRPGIRQKLSQLEVGFSLASSARGDRRKGVHVSETKKQALLGRSQSRQGDEIFARTLQHLLIQAADGVAREVR